MIKSNILKGLFALSLATVELSAAETEQFEGNWTKSYETLVGPVSHTPERVSMGFMSAGTAMNINAKNFNGVLLLAPICLKVNQTQELFEQAMRDSGITK